MARGNRWYDRDPTLADAIEGLKDLDARSLDRVMAEVERVIVARDETLLERYVDRFEVRRRWYDRNPYTWLIVNSLQFAPKDVVDEVRDCLHRSLSREA